MTDPREASACKPIAPSLAHFNSRAKIPFGCTSAHIFAAMTDFVNFLGFINAALHKEGIVRLESMLMPANFSSIVGEFMGAAIPKHCTTLVKNAYHNGHPDLIPAGAHPKNALQHHHEGIEIKGSRYTKGWQGHNAEDTWLMVFVFDSNRPVDEGTADGPRPFRFVEVSGAALEKSDWKFAGRSETSRRTITAAVTPTGYAKMMANWIYREPPR
ncbi:MAG: hypothetical protein IT343_23525 [Candidatus Melainabacteria bacterium]|nr:hypothetical protein [Candidatus Melainabacteria bacterium]